jgi:hypothetical protein
MMELMLTQREIEPHISSFVRNEPGQIKKWRARLANRSFKTCSARRRKHESE